MDFCQAITACYRNQELCARRAHQPDECYVVTIERGIERYIRGQLMPPMLEYHLDVFTTLDWSTITYQTYLKECGR